MRRQRIGERGDPGIVTDDHQVTDARPGGVDHLKNRVGRRQVQDLDVYKRQPFDSGDELLQRARAQGFELFELVMANERTWRSEQEVRAGLLRLWSVMQACVERGFRQTGLLPGVLKVRRRAPKLYRMLIESQGAANPLDVMDWVNAWALAVNEENAAGGRVVTAPTNGAAGIVPAVLHFYRRFEPGANDDGVIRFLLTAGAIGMLYKKNASISGAEMGCQGEVGVACSMAAAGLVAALHGTSEQVENAAEIGMEHNLGPVSYTHLDVYKRQEPASASTGIPSTCWERRR